MASPGVKLLHRLAWHLDCDVTEIMAKPEDDQDDAR